MSDDLRLALSELGPVRPWCVEREHSVERGLAVETAATCNAVRAIVGETLYLRAMDGYRGWFITTERITR